MIRLALLAALCLFACTPVKDADAAWARAKADTDLCGTWKTEKGVVAVTAAQDKGDPRLLIWGPGMGPIAAKQIELVGGQMLLLSRTETEKKEMHFSLLEKTEDKNFVLKDLTDEALKNAVSLGELEGYDKKTGLPLTEKNLAYLNRLASQQPAAWKCAQIYVREK
ncbi:MAG: hypothetical protein RL095_1492 [Verrucomicrobiota bacterium]|jgi:hypothetical protein